MSSILLVKYIKEALGREIMYSPKRLSLDGKPSVNLKNMYLGIKDPDILQRELTNIKQILKLPKDVGLSNTEEDRIKYIEFVIKDLAKNVGPNTFIRFEDQWDSSIIPPLAVSPTVKWETPHGIYGYPLEEKNLESLILKGKPTRAAYATQFDFFHVYKINSPKAVTTFIDDFENKAINTKYSSRENVIKDIAECIRLTTSLLKNNKEPVIASESDINNFEESLNSTFRNLEDFFVSMFAFNNLHLETGNTTQSIVAKYKTEIAEIAFKMYSRKNPKKASKKLTVQFYYLKLVKSLIEQIADVVSLTNRAKRGQYYSLLLKSIGIDAIIDKGTKSIHRNEPSQSVSTDFSGKNIKVIGTYKNVFANLYTSEKESLYKFLLKFISNPNKKIKWDWNQQESKTAEDVNYETLSLEEYKSLRKVISKRAQFSDAFSACIRYSYDGLKILNYEIEHPNSFFKHKDNVIVEDVINAVSDIDNCPTEFFEKIINLVNNKKYAIDTFALHKNAPRKYVKAKFDEAIKNQSTNHYITMLLKNPQINSNDIQKLLELPDNAFKSEILSYVWQNKNITSEQLELIYAQSKGENLSILKNSNYPINPLMEKFFYLIDEEETLEAFQLLKYIVKNNNITRNDLQELVDFVVERYGDSIIKNFMQGNVLIHLTLCKHFDQTMADQIGVSKEQILNRAEASSLFDSWEDKNGANFLKNNPQISKLK